MALIDVVVAGEAGQMDEADLLKLEGGFEDDQMVLTWVQYHLKTSGDMVHRSVDAKLKQAATSAAAGQF